MRAIIHIGAEKIGTSGIQNFCANNRAALERVGVCYPACLGSTNHTRLAAFAMENHRIDDVRQDLGIFTPGGILAFRQGLREELSREIREAGGVSCLLFSSELLHSRLLEKSEIIRLKEFLERYTDDFRIIVYLRRQDRAAFRRQSTELKAGSTDAAPVFPLVDRVKELPRYYDYNKMLSLYEQVFGIENINVRIFEKKKLVRNSLISDFVDACDIPRGDYVVDPPQNNRALSEAGLAFFRRLNVVEPRFIDGRANPGRAEIAEMAGKRLAGDGPRVDPEAAKTFHAHFHAGNLAISARYFPDWNGALFDNDFSAYDVQADQDIDPKELIDFAIHVWRNRTKELETLRLSEALRRFRLVAHCSQLADRQLDSITLNPSLPHELLCRYLGALLFSQSYGRAAAAAADMARLGKAKSLLVTVEAFALARGGDTSALGALIERQFGAPRLVRSLSAFNQEPFQSADRQAWLGLLANGDEPQKTMHDKCLSWLG